MAEASFLDPKIIHQRHFITNVTQADISLSVYVLTPKNPVCKDGQHLIKRTDEREIGIQ